MESVDGTPMSGVEAGGFLSATRSIAAFVGFAQGSGLVGI
jgi:hypothetical protein